MITVYASVQSMYNSVTTNTSDSTRKSTFPCTVICVCRQVLFVKYMEKCIYCVIASDKTLSKVETHRDSSAHIILNCFQCIAHVFECNALKMT